VEDLSKKYVFVHGPGWIEVFLAQTLAKDFGKVFLSIPWLSAFPTPHLQWIGKNIPGIIRVDSYEDTKRIVKENKGLFFFPDCGDGDKQLELRKDGQRVFGAGESGELEFNRSLFKKVLKDRGLPVPPFRVVTGIDDLRSILKKEDNLWVKLDVEVRGIMETKKHVTYKTSISWLDKLAHELGWLRNITKFMIETPVGEVEGGSDQFRANGIILSQSLCGFEDKGNGYVAKVIDTDNAPMPIKKVNEAMLPVYKKYKTCGANSSEIRNGEKGREKDSFYIDAAERFGNPPAASKSAVYKNFSRICWTVAGGEMIKPEFNAPYVAEIPIEHPDATKEPIPFEITEKQFDSIKLKNVCYVKEEKQYYNIPFSYSSTIAKAVGLGQTLEEAELAALDAAENFKCEGKVVDKETFNTLDETLKKSERYGWGRF
jgi:hypothetical protein